MSERPQLGATKPADPAATAFARSVIKEPVWKWEVPVYFYVGGLAGASAGLALLSELRGESGPARRAWGAALAGSVVSPALLIADLGRSARFLHMLRMFKVSSPMSVGSWVLATFGGATSLAALHSFTGGRLGWSGRVAQSAAALLGLPLSSYTGALIANTSVPVWHEARRILPFVFVAGAAQSAGAVAVLLSPVEQAQAGRRLLVGGAVVELALIEAMERRLRAAGIGDAYHEARAGRYERTAKLATTCGAAITAAAGGRSRVAAVAGGALASLGALGERLTIFHAGLQSAARPQDTVVPQRARIQVGVQRGAARRGARHAAVQISRDGHPPGERRPSPGSPALGR